MSPLYTSICGRVACMLKRIFKCRMLIRLKVIIKREIYASARPCHLHDNLRLHPEMLQPRSIMKKYIYRTDFAPFNVPIVFSLRNLVSVIISVLSWQKVVFFRTQRYNFIFQSLYIPESFLTVDKKLKSHTLLLVRNYFTIPESNSL